jgi:hypothetical protein
MKVSGLTTRNMALAFLYSLMDLLIKAAILRTYKKAKEFINGITVMFTRATLEVA